MSANAVKTNATTDAEHREIGMIARLVDHIETLQREERFDDYIALFHPDATWVTGLGHRFTVAELDAFARNTLPNWNKMLKGGRFGYDVVEVTFVRPDVVVVSTQQKAIQPDGETYPDRPSPQGSLTEPESRVTYVMAKDDAGEWRVVLGQNTPVRI